MTDQPNQDLHSRSDPHSFARIDEVRVNHIALDLKIFFDRRLIEGWVSLVIERQDVRADCLTLDTRDLNIRLVESATPDGAFKETSFFLGAADPVLGRPLTVSLPPDAVQVRIHYSTHPGASGLQWLEADQTASKKHPFLYTQSQAIHARSWIPLQDSPSVRVTYEAVIRNSNRSLCAVMSAESQNNLLDTATGEHRFVMDQPIPSYLIALAVGDLVFIPMSERTGVWAEPTIAEQAAREFEDTEAMMRSVERLYGPYRWGRHDILVLPPSFPFGGMENPRLTFVTPTILVGDKSLVSLVAHELAHSWSGNLVTNATWSDFWLNEGVTVYLENRVQEEIFGAHRAAMEASLEIDKLVDEMAHLPEADQLLQPNLSRRDPDEGFTLVPYIKGMLFLLQLEQLVGREEFDNFLCGYFEFFAFQSITTSDFLSYSQKHLLAAHPGAMESVRKWIEEPGLPDGYARPCSGELAKVAYQAQKWLADGLRLSTLKTSAWTTQHWLAWLRALPEDVGKGRLQELDQTFRFTSSANAEILYEWLLLALHNDYRPADVVLTKFLVDVGRRKFLKPLYEELVKTHAGRSLASAIYAKAKSGYHPITAATVEQILGVPSSR